MSRDGRKLALVLPDIHLPRENKAALAAVEAYMADQKFDYWIQLGDLIDNESISAFNDGKPRKMVSAPTVLEQFDYANDWLDKHLAVLKKKSPECQKHFIEGNHCERTERYVDKNPQLAGLVDVPRGLRLKERGINWIPYWSKGQTLRIGKLHFIHGTYPVANHAAKHVREYGCNVVYGHVHDYQVFTHKKMGDDQTIMGMSLGCLCDFKQPYMRGRPHNWVHMFGVVHFWPNGMFEVVPVTMINSRFVGPTNGRTYDGKALLKMRARQTARRVQKP